MPAPATSPAFATDTNFAADGDPWSGDPTKADPGSSRRAEGFEPDLLPAEWLNYILNLIGAWLLYLSSFINGTTDEFIYPSTKTRIVLLPGLKATGTNVSPGTSSDVILGASAEAFMSIELPTGATVTDVSFRIQTSTNTGANRLRVMFSRATFSGTGTVIGSTLATSGFTGDETLSLGVLSEVIDNDTNTYWVQCRGSITSGDNLIAVQITFTDPGPRNF